MFEQWKVKQKIDIPDVLRKGTVGVVTTILSGIVFGKENMMIAFVMVLGANIYEKENLKIKTWHKIFHLMLRDLLIVLVAFLASQNVWWGIPINLLAIFVIIFTLLSLYDQISYKTFMMLYVFSQYSAISISELPKRLILVVFVLSCILASSMLQQSRNKAVLNESFTIAWSVIREQLHLIFEGEYDPQRMSECKQCLDRIVHDIYQTGYKRSFTTHQGKLQFYFYMNFSYLFRKIKVIQVAILAGSMKKEELTPLLRIADGMDDFFHRKITREEVTLQLEQAWKNTSAANGSKELIGDMIFLFYKNFIEWEKLNYKEKDVPYMEWERANVTELFGKLKNDFSMKSMRFNFASRLAVILTISLFLANELGFYKIIWAIIPIMSVTRPYYEETMQRRKERFRSNILACIIVGVVLNVIHVEWISLLFMVIGFYFVYAFKDYYRMSFFLTIISMSLSSFSGGINVLIAYRLLYLVVGLIIVGLGSRILPYKTEDGMRELVLKIQILRRRLEAEHQLSLEGKENPHIIRETIIHSELLSQHAAVKNKIYQSKDISEFLTANSNFVIELGHQLLRNE